MTVLLCKLVLAPAFVVLISLAVRRFGPRIGGLLGGLPVVAGPILFVYALDQGTAFAGEAARNSLCSLVGLAGFLVVVVFASPRRGAMTSVVFGWLAFVAIGGVLAWLALPPVAGLVATALMFAFCLRVIPEPDPRDVAAAPRRPRHDLLLRGAVAASMVLVLTSVAGQLGPVASGVLAPFPTITSVLAGFAIAHETRATTLNLIRNMVRGFSSFAACLFALAVTLEPWSTGPAFLAAIAVTVGVQAALLLASERRSRVAVAA